MEGDLVEYANDSYDSVIAEGRNKRPSGIRLLIFEIWYQPLWNIAADEKNNVLLKIETTFTFFINLLRIDYSLFLIVIVFCRLHSQTDVSVVGTTRHLSFETTSFLLSCLLSYKTIFIFKWSLSFVFYVWCTFRVFRKDFEVPLPKRGGW